VVTVPVSLPVKNLAELVQYAKTLPDGKLNNGTPTTSFVLVAETLTSTAGVKFNHILYKGSVPVVTACSVTRSRSASSTAPPSSLTSRPAS
jgi:tripartite-type tricarboxylate transporter receptor subunit TctC